MPPKNKLSKLDTELFSAVKDSDAKAVAKHLAAGANPNARDKDGYMALHHAASDTSPEIIQLLLDAGAEVDGLDSDSAIALSFATARTDGDAVERVKLLIAKGANVNHQWDDEDRPTILTDLLNQENNEEPSAEILKTLLQAGANPNLPNGRGETPLMLAVGYTEQPELTELLLEHGAQVNAVDAEGASALMNAVKDGNVRLVERLIAKGADVNQAATYDQGNTVLTMALHLDEVYGDPSPKVVDALLRGGANPNKPNATGWAPLHLAACIEDVKFTELLLQAGADVKTPNAGGYCAIDLASSRNHKKVVKRLLAAGSPTPEQAAAERMERLWKRIGAWYAKNNAAYAKSVEQTRPAKPEEISTLEKALGAELPLDFRAFLLRFGGGSPPGEVPMSISEYEVLPVRRILERWKGLEELREKGTFADTEPHELSESQEEVAWTWWHSGWVPLAQDSGGNLYCVDLAPGPEGQLGQVIKWEMHDGPLSPRAESLEDFFGEYLEGLEDGSIELDSD
ncbi:ankyrin repeat domain-containing protein [Hyalangium versicolor]|uniref:ankyrin repeat domain-containing protein n=1 Tax=Hyalangium versicolor TaxID=2861190 RepID=UPI001CCDFE4A|nr:ankyrin repeat domain-containing protein [Hyalangium versicolor]